MLTGQKRIEYLQLRKLPKLTGNGLQFVKSPALVKLDLKANINIDTKGMNHALLHIHLTVYFCGGSRIFQTLGSANPKGLIFG